MHGWSDDEVFGGPLELMCEPAQPCTRDAYDDGVDPILAQCHGRPEGNFSEALACLRGLVYAVCAATQAAENASANATLGCYAAAGSYTRPLFGST